MPRMLTYLSLSIIALLNTLPAPAGAQSLEQFDLHSLTYERSASAGEPNVEQAERALIDRTNQLRQEHNLPAVKTDSELVETAQYFADYMARTGRYGHEADGRRPSERARQHGYDFCIITENIAQRFSTAGFTTDQLASGFMQGWIESPEHRHNLLDPDVTQIGVAIAEGEKNRFYAVQMFGRPASARIAFKISNQSDADIRYTIAGEGEGQQFDLPPRYTRTHQLCRPSQIRFSWNQQSPLTPSSGTHYVIRGSAAQGLEVTKAEETNTAAQPQGPRR